MSAKRTPIGAFLGALSPLTAVQLGSAAIKAAVASAGVQASELDEVIMGCVLPAGLGQAPARQAALGAGAPHSVPCTTINKMCGSALKAVMLGADQIRAGSAQLVLAGGLESMSNAPYLLPKARTGYRMGHGEVLDHMFYDGLQSPFDGKLMGCFGDATAAKYNFTRAAQDAFATESVRRAVRALEAGEFDAEVTPVTVKSRKGEIGRHARRDARRLRYQQDHHPEAGLRQGRHRHGGQLLLDLGRGGGAGAGEREAVKSRGLKPLARVLAYATHAHEPEWFTTAPGGAIKKVLAQLGWKAQDVDLYEVNEAFAAVTMAAMHDVGIDHARINVNGGACALGHPVGATGARILTTLLYALRKRGGKRGDRRPVSRGRRSRRRGRRIGVIGSPVGRTI